MNGMDARGDSSAFATLVARPWLPVAGVFTLFTAVGSVSLYGLKLRFQSACALEKDGSTITVVMEDCDTQRPGRLTSANIPKDLKPEDIKKDPEAFTRRLLDAFQPEKLVKKGRFRGQGESVDIYLPEAKESYTVVNKGKGDSDQENESTLISIDSDRDGKLTAQEGWFASLPVRIGDRMWEVVSITEDGSRMEIKPSSKPLAGAVVGRKCPPFSYKSEDGKHLTQDTYKGKALIIDIWSVT